MEQGFSYSPAAAAEETQALLGRAMGRGPVKGHVAGTGKKPTQQHEGSRAVGAVESTIHNATHKITAEDRVIQTLHGVREAGNSLWMLGWVSLPFLPIPLPIPSIVGKIAGKVGLRSVETAVNMAIEGATKTVRGVSLNQAHLAPGALLKNAATIAKESGEAAQAAGKTVWISKMAKPLGEAADSVDGIMSDVASSLGEMTQKPRAAISNGIDAFGNSGVGRGISNKLEGVFTWRQAAHTAKSVKHIGAATAAFTQEPRGFFAKIAAFITRKPPVTIDMPKELAGVMSHVNAASALSGAERTARLGHAMAALTDVAKDASGELASHAGAIQGKIAAALKSSAKVTNYGEALKGGISVAIKNGVRSMGNAKLLTAAIAVGAVAGTVATFMSARKENKQAAQALADMKAAIGNTNPELVAIASQKASKRSLTSMLGAAVSSVGEFLSIGVASGHAAGNVVAAQMGIAMAAGQVVSDNPVLNAHAMLTMREKGTAQLEFDDGMKLRCEIIGAKKSLEKHGGKHNRLVAAMAHEFETKNVPVNEMCRITGNEAEFTALSEKIFAKQQEAKAASLKDQPKHAEKPTISQEAAPINVVGAANAANQPSMKLSGKIEHQGRVQSQELKRA